MKQKIILLVLLLLTLITLFVTPMIGIKWIIPDIFSNSELNQMESTIFWKVRLPRVSIAFFAGASLALSGMVFQAVFRNTLATPFTLGVASGASLGAASYIWFGFAFQIFGIAGQSIFAFSGALLSIGLVYGITRMKRNMSTTTMLLTGVAISFFFSSTILFMQYLSDFTSSVRILRWLMGGLEIVGFDTVLKIIPFTMLGSVVIYYFSRELNLMVAGQEFSISRGVNTNATVKILFLITSMLVGSIVATCGPIGFIGMMAPHICRLILGTDHRYLIPASLLFGGMFLVICDTLARTLIAPVEIPVGIITAFLGGPFFLWLLVRNQFENGY